MFPTLHKIREVDRTSNVTEKKKTVPMNLKIKKE